MGGPPPPRRCKHWRSSYGVATESSATQEQPYKECHCWAFTPSSVELIVRDLQYLGFVNLEIDGIRGSDSDACEFYVHMVKRRDYVQYTRHEFYACRTRPMAQISSELAAPIVHHGRYYGVSLIKVA